MSTLSNSKKAFQFALLSIVAMLIFISLKQLVGSEKLPTKNYSYFSAISMFMVVLFSFIGFIYNMRGIKEPRSFKKVSSLILNTILMFLFLITTIINAIDMINYTEPN